MASIPRKKYIEPIRDQTIMQMRRFELWALLIWLSINWFQIAITSPDTVHDPNDLCFRKVIFTGPLLRSNNMNKSIQLNQIDLMPIVDIRKRTDRKRANRKELSSWWLINQFFPQCQLENSIRNETKSHGKNCLICILDTRARRWTGDFFIFKLNLAINSAARLSRMKSPHLHISHTFPHRQCRIDAFAYSLKRLIPAIHPPLPAPPVLVDCPYTNNWKQLQMYRK